MTRDSLWTSAAIHPWKHSSSFLWPLENNTSLPFLPSHQGRKTKQNKTKLKTPNQHSQSEDEMGLLVLWCVLLEFLKQSDFPVFFPPRTFLWGITKGHAERRECSANTLGIDTDINTRSVLYSSDGRWGGRQGLRLRNCGSKLAERRNAGP